MRNKLTAKTLSLILVVVLLTSVTPTIYATGTPHTISIGLNAFFEMGNDEELTERTGTSHMSYVDDMRNTVEGSLAMEILGLIYGTGDEPDESKYMEVLVNIMKTYEQENASAISEQHKMDNLKAIEDYGMDILDIGVSLIPGMKGVDKSTEQLGDWIKIAISGLETMAGNTTNWIEGISDLETIIQNYAKHDAFLALIETKADDSLKKAASTLRTSMAEAMKIKLNSYSDISNENFQNYTEFFFEDLFFEALKLTDLYDTDDAFQVFVDLGSNVFKLWTAIKVGVEIGKFIGNIAVGSEDVINRVLEMKAVYDISEILENELTSIKQNFDDAYSIETDTTAQTYITYGYYLISSRIRGEYCMYSMLAKDSGLYSHFGDETAKKAERVYNNLTLKLADVKKNLDMIPSVLVVNVGAEMPYEAVNTISEWNVYGANGQLYDNYTLRVYDKQSLINFVRTGPVDEPDPAVTEYVVNGAEPLQVTLEEGYAYTFEFVDNDNPDKIELLTVGVTDSDLKLITVSDIETNFGDTASVSYYIPVIEKALAETAYDSTTGSGFLYDIDGDSVDELVFVNVYAAVGGNFFPGHAYSVYDIENGEAIAKCDKELLFYDAGGPSGYVGVVNYLGDTALVVYIDNGETGYAAQRESIYTLYDPDNLQVIASASLDYVSSDTVQVNNCTVNGNYCSYNDYLSVVNAIEPIMMADIYSNDVTDGSMGLYELLRFIQEVSGMTPDQSPQITKVDAEKIANSVWGEYLKREQGFDWKIFEEDSLIKDGIEYYCFTLQTNSKYGATDWSVFYYLFVNSVTGEYSNSLY